MDLLPPSPSPAREAPWPGRRHAPRALHNALVLQGGGALGAYQAGVYEALARHGIAPDWVAGVSIGGINAALIAGNPPERRVERLREFWDLCSSGVALSPPGLSGAGEGVRRTVSQVNAGLVAAFGAPGFFRPRPLGPWLALPGTAAAVSFYDTTPLRDTLLRLVDFGRLNGGEVRVMMGAVNVETGNTTVFDTATTRLGPEHVMASGALPPGFPPIEIDGQHYWDGGLVSNTPLQFVLDAAGADDVFALQVDLFPSRGALPQTLLDADEREKDIRYSSRTRFNTDANLRLHAERAAVRRLLASLPAELAGTEDARLLRGIPVPGAVTVIQLIYRKRAYEGGTRDYEFSRRAMLDHWRNGMADVEHFLARHPGPPPLPEDGSVVVIDPGLEDGPPGPGSSGA